MSRDLQGFRGAGSSARVRWFRDLGFSEFSGLGLSGFGFSGLGVRGNPQTLSPESFMGGLEVKGSED